MTDTALTTATNNLPSDLNQLTVEIKFYFNQWGQNTIEIGKRLIAAKELVGHGNFGKWLEDNFNLSQQTARKFMQVAERFGKTRIDTCFNSTQMIAMLALPEGEEEKFIEAKTAEGTPVEDMTVKQLRAKVAKYKAELEKKNSEVTDLFVEKSSLESTVKTMQNNFDNLTSEKNQLEEELMKAGEHSAEIISENEELKLKLENQESIEKIVVK